MHERQQRPRSLADVARHNPWALVLAVPLLFIVMLGIFQATEAFLDWPETSREREIATYVALGVALLPLVLAIGSQAFTFLSERGGSVEASAAWASLKVDFSRRAEQARTTQQMQMPANITPENVGDRGSNEVISAVAQASACNAVGAVLTLSGLSAEPDVRPASLRNWAGRRLYDDGLPLEQVARRMGARSLDTVAADIALDWRHLDGQLPDGA